MAYEPTINAKPAWKARTTRQVVPPAEDPSQFYARREAGMSRAEWEAAESAKDAEVADAPSEKVAAFVVDMAKVPGKTPPEPDKVEVVVVDTNQPTGADPQAWGTAVAVAKSDPQVKAAAQAAHPPAAPSRARKEPGAEPACEGYESPRKGGVFMEPDTIAEGETRYKAVNDRLKWLRAVRTSKTAARKQALNSGKGEEVARLDNDLVSVNEEVKQARARLVLLDRRIKVLKAAG